MFICVWIEGDGEPVYFEDIGSDLHFAEMRKTIHNSLENKQYGSRFPVLLKTPLSYADFSPKRVEALEKEILTIIGEKKKLIIVPKYSVSIKSADIVIRMLKIILKGGRVAIDKNATFAWLADIFDENKALVIIEETQKILKHKGKILNINTIPLDDEKTYKLISTAKTKGIYLLGDKDMRRHIKKTSIDNFKDLLPLVAMYSNGIIGAAMMDDFIKIKNREIKIKYSHPLFKKILNETYGVILYLEQIREILQIVGGLSPETAEKVRKCMLKTMADKEEMDKYRDSFIKGAIKNGLTKKEAERTFDLILYFAKYRMSKSFATKHATYAYQTAYLKAHYPTVFNEANTSLHNLLLVK